MIFLIHFQDWPFCIGQPLGTLSSEGDYFPCSQHSLVLCSSFLGPKPYEVSSFCFSMPIVTACQLGQDMFRQVRLHECSFWYFWETQSHNKVPFLLGLTVLLPRPQWSLHLRVGVVKNMYQLGLGSTLFLLISCGYSVMFFCALQRDCALMRVRSTLNHEYEGKYLGCS